jgi:hypothetical protein
MSLNLTTLYFIFMIFLLTLILIFLWRMSAFTHGGAYKVILNDVELSKTLAPW